MLYLYGWRRLGSCGVPDCLYDNSDTTNLCFSSVPPVHCHSVDLLFVLHVRRRGDQVGLAGGCCDKALSVIANTLVAFFATASPRRLRDFNSRSSISVSHGEAILPERSQQAIMAICSRFPAQLPQEDFRHGWPGIQVSTTSEMRPRQFNS